ncbi:glycoside hydrolase family 15 protein [Brevibacillus brevis]|uniref:Glycoside hydrolase family 15 protein n=1 Tax=Brevibacillus brevis TaxID=1393 RepID=A0ABY9T4V1_BREBE|nr:glycoside hydrolase family 15 protein [Brevibacillus brevis]WNC13423.1 glycoside hydrolase family 15 protein [Brevibacillus brevis]
MTITALAEESVRIIIRHQAKSGAYVASPGFAAYRYAWLRDGTFTAYAMDRAGQHESARRFYQWCGSVVLRHAEKARSAIAAVRAGERTGGNERFLHTRYTVDGDEVCGQWGSFQLDGYGAWLWGLAEHVRLVQDAQLIRELRPAVDLTLDYLQACWRLPNYDCWEEWGDRQHPATMAAIFGGVRAMAGHFPERAEELGRLADDIREFVLVRGTAEGQFVKSLGNPVPDASLLWLSVPFGLVEPDDLLMKGTVQAIERELLAGWGLHRYAADTYYGGGQWPLLSAWLGWYYARTGREEEALHILKWIASHKLPAGFPEQVQDHLLSPDSYRQWVEREGQPAVPLLWTHAMYLVLAAELGLTENPNPTGPMPNPSV